MPLRAKIDPTRLNINARMNHTSSSYEEGSPDEVLVRSNGAVREFILNRPKKLNAINHNMCTLMAPRLLEYAKSDSANIIVVKGAGGKAFSAGGDVTALALMFREQGAEVGEKNCSRYFQTEFALDHLIATYAKPYVALIDGITMGGGVGLSAHAPFVVATEKTLWAMPETTIGYYPDVGGLFRLSRMDGQLGLYLGMTSDRLKGYDVYRAGVATHFVPSERVPEIEKRLSELRPSNGDATSDEYFSLVNRAIEEFAADAPANHKPTLSDADRDVIDTCFKFDTVEEIIAALEAEGSAFALKTKATLLDRCPHSLKVTLAGFRKAKSLDIKSVFALEQHIADGVCGRNDFAEGVIALLVDKRKPVWEPASLEQISASDIAKIFAPRKPDWTPMKFHTDRTYMQYPHKFGLPTEEEIMLFVTGETSSSETKATRDDVVKHFEKTHGNKVGLVSHIEHVLARKTKADPQHPTLLDWTY